VQVTLLDLMANQDNWEDLRAANRANWDERVAVHLGSRFYDVEGWLRDRPGPRRYEAEAIGDVTGLRLLHLQCHFGLDTLAWARAGARVTGLDFAPSAVVAARDIARRAGLAERAEFVCADVYDAVGALGHAEFDVVYVTLGALCWLPSVERWAAQVGALVAPGGRFYLHDGHPLAWALAEDRPEVVRSYYEEPEPLADDSGYTYTDAQTAPMANRHQYEWNHGIGETLSALVRHGLRLEWLVEHDWTVWPHFPWLVEKADGTWGAPVGGPRLPLSFSLLATRAAGPIAE
jgi:SAM-dependent methyltransferase